MLLQQLQPTIGLPNGFGKIANELFSLAICSPPLMSSLRVIGCTLLVAIISSLIQFNECYRFHFSIPSSISRGLSTSYSATKPPVFYLHCTSTRRSPIVTFHCVVISMNIITISQLSSHTSQCPPPSSRTLRLQAKCRSTSFLSSTLLPPAAQYLAASLSFPTSPLQTSRCKRSARRESNMDHQRIPSSQPAKTAPACHPRLQCPPTRSAQP